MAKNLKSLKTEINTCFYDLKKSQEILIKNTLDKEVSDDSKKQINEICKGIIKKNITTVSLNDEGMHLLTISIDEYHKNKRTDVSDNNNDDLVFRIINNNEDYSIITGIYCGVVNIINGYSIEICSGYSDKFFMRMLNYCCGIYTDSKTAKGVVQNDSIYRLLIQYMFLMSLRKVAAKAIPKRFIKENSRGYNINGNIDVEAFVNGDLLSFDKKITYTYSKRLEIQAVIDILHSAIEACQISKNMEILPNIVTFRHHLKELYSGIRPSKNLINNIHKAKFLNNSLYSDYKKPLEYAKILLKNKELNSGKINSTSEISGFLVDASFLWEMYLYNVMRMNLDDWYIQSQSFFVFYEETFYSKKNYPDFILQNKITGDVYIFDAKFKTMKYRGIDVDNKDLQQLHSYAYYYQIKYGDKFKGAGLIYPSQIEKPDNKKSVSKLYGLEESNKIFGIFSIKDPSNEETMDQSEKVFIDQLTKFLND